MTTAGAEPRHDDLAAVLRWYSEMGVDAVVDATPHDRFAEARSVPAPSTAGRPPLGRTAPTALGPKPAGSGAVPIAASATLSADDAIRSAREVAAAAPTLEALRDALASFEGCALKATASRTVFGEGDPGSAVMVIGEPPGADDDRQGKPFSGPPGELFDRMLRAIGLERQRLFCTTVLPWRPPGGRAPTPHEIALCLPFIARQIELVAPTVLLCFGTAAQILLPTRETILRSRGTWLGYLSGQTTIRAMPIHSPGHLLLHPSHKKLAWRDLQEVQRAIGAIAGQGDTPASSG